MIPVKSSNIEAVGYDEATKVMKVKFKSGGIHSYADVPKEVHEKFIGAESIGKHFHANIRSAFKSTKF